MIENEIEVVETSFFVNVFWIYKLNGFFIVIEVIDICFDSDGNSLTRLYEDHQRWSSNYR